MANPPSSSSSPARRARIQHLLSRTDARLAHLTRLLSTPAGTDAALKTIAYALLLLHARLSTSLTHHLERLALRLAKDASQALLPGEALVANVPAPRGTARLARAADATGKLAALVGDFRVFVRLWGLLGVYAWAKQLRAAPPADRGLRLVAWGQVGACAAYQALENAAYLAQHGVLEWEGRRTARAWAWSCRFWAAHVGLEFVRLGREWALRRREARAAGGEEKEEKVGRKEEEERWWRDLLVNAAWAPLTLHWSMEEGFLSEAWVGFFGTVAGVTGLRQLWKETA